MTRARVIAWTTLAAVVTALVVAAFVFLPRWYAQANETADAPEPPAAAPAPKIKARLFYVSDDGLHLVAIEREVPFGEGTLEQAQRIVEAQLARPEPPLLSAIPNGTRLRAIFLDGRGDAVVDLSGEVSTAHTGGTLDELLTVYSIVNAVTTNLPAVKAVQILVDGHEVDSLAGHVDLRRPLAAGAAWVQAPGGGTPAR